MPDTTEIAATGFFRGTKTSQQRARTALPILVRQAEARQTMFYGELAHEMGIPSPRTLNHPLDSIGRALQDLGRRWDRQVPSIQALVINKSSGCPGAGFAFFAPDAKVFRRATRRERRRLVDRMLDVEAPLRSGDSLDVLFSDSNRRIAVEVKGASAPVGEVIRGLFQCVKYEAVLDAEARVDGSRADCKAVLALGGSFPGKHTPLRHTLGVTVFENLG